MSRRLRQITPIALLGLAVCVSACVTKGKYSKTKDALKRCEADRTDRDGRIAQLELKKRELGQELDTLKKDTKKLRNNFEKQLDATKDELAELAKRRKAAEKRAKEFEDLTKSFSKMISAGNIKVYTRRGRMIVALPSSVLFASAKATLSRRGERALARVAKKLAKMGENRRYLVAGHTDSQGIGPKVKEQFADNWELSAVRAINVTRFLVKQGMSPKTLAAAGYGPFDPVRSNKSRTGRALNRRIEIMLIPKIPDIKKGLRNIKRKKSKKGKR